MQYSRMLTKLGMQLDLLKVSHTQLSSIHRGHVNE